MKPYIYLPHTADAKFNAFGKSLEEAFSNSAYALTSLITDYKKIESKLTKKIELKSEDEKALLYDFLEQFLIFLDSENFILHKIESIKITKAKNYMSLTALISGDNNLKKYKTEKAIKAVTYEEMEITKEKGKITVQVVLDI